MAEDEWTLLGLAGGAVSFVAEELAAVAIGSASSSPIGDGLRDLKRAASSRLREKFKRGGLKVAAQQDLERALILAYAEAGRNWLLEVSAIELAEEAEERDAFVARVYGYLGEAERAAYNRAIPVRNALLDQDLLTGVLSHVGGVDIFNNDRETIEEAVTIPFFVWLVQKEEQDLPSFAMARVSAHFGREVVTQYVEILREGRFPEANQAFDHYLSAELRELVVSLSETVADGSESTQAVLADCRLKLDQIAAGTARIEGNQALLKQKVDEIDAHLRLRGTVILDRKPKLVVSGRTVDLHFRQRGTRLVGRRQELWYLHQFLNAEPLFYWWQIAGTGGQGKSRLALHLIDTLGARWDAGFIGAEELSGFDFQRAAFPVPTLIVVDYAAVEQKSTEVVRVIRTLAARAKPGHPNRLHSTVRLLVLERAGYSFADAGGQVNQNWLSPHLNNHEQVLELRAAAFSEHTALFLADMSREDMLAIARSWRAHQDLRPLSPEEEHQLIQVLKVDPEKNLLKRQKAWRPLFAMMCAGAFTSDRANLALMSGEISTLLHEALKDEFDRYNGHQLFKPSRLACDMACLATMVGGLSYEPLLRLQEQGGEVAQLVAAFEQSDDANLRQAFLLAGFLPDSIQPDPQDGIVLPAREPDLLGEYMLIWTFLGEARQGEAQRKRVLSERAAWLIEQAVRLNPVAAFAFLIRMREDFPDLEETEALAETPWPQVTSLPAGAEIASAIGLSGYLAMALATEGLDLKSEMPLLMASQNGYEGIVTRLLAAGADVSAVNVETGMFPLLMASQQGHEGIVTRLLATGAEASAVNVETGTFPLLMASQEGHEGIVARLLAAGADVSAVNVETGTFPLLMASKNGHEGIVARLLAAGADVSAVNAVDGTFPLLQASHQGHEGIVARLLAAGADVSAVNAVDGTFPLLQASQNGHEGIVARLLAAGADVSAVNVETGTFPLLMASKNGHEGIVARLLAAGADANAIHADGGYTALFTAIATNKPACIALLLSYGADPRFLHVQTGLTPLTLAQQRGHAECEALIVEALGGDGADG